MSFVLAEFCAYACAPVSPVDSCVTNFAAFYCFTFCLESAFLTADIFASCWVLPLSRLRAYTLQDATFYTCSYLYTGDLTISTVKSRYSHCFNCLRLFYVDRQHPKYGRFWPS